jgi:outer membrane lipoprotein SlyB
MSKALWHLSWILCLTASGCQSEQSFRPGQQTTIRFGTVTHVEQVRQQSDAAAGAIIGGTLGLIGSGGSRNAGRNALLGAAIGGAGTAAVQGNRTAIAYTVNLLDGSTIRIITDQSEIRVGDCVAIERAGETNNIRRRPASYCVRENQPVVQAVRIDTETLSAHCEAAKDELVRATTPEAVDVAIRKVRLLCD